LYVLASESRLLLTKDVDSNSFCYVPIEITLKATEHHDLFKYSQMAPCLLPELEKIKEVKPFFTFFFLNCDLIDVFKIKLKILGPRYYSIKFSDELNFIDLKNILSSQLYVKQKNGYFSYHDDPKDEKAYNIRNFLSKTIVPRRITVSIIFLPEALTFFLI
jgi:anaphase-promoting complex subunit 1